MGLAKYFRKRNFGKTPEPKGKEGRASGKKLRFVVQEHHASALHYDFRLELDGVLKSWAVPKGPSLNTHDRHLAMQVEDHPYEYRTFEGEIPEGNYGAGTVIIWDAGTYEPRAQTDDAEKTLRAELKKGHLTFVMHGQKLHGEFALVRMQSDDADERAWLLIKKDDEYASEKIDITAQDQSIKSGKRVDDLGNHMTHPNLEDYPQVQKPWHVRPMLCTLIDEPFDKQGWLFEMKWDGYRAIAAKHGSGVDLYSRTGNSFLDNYPPVAEAVRALKHDVILDGEIAVTDSEGRPHFELLQNWRRDHGGVLHYYVFDILWYNGRDVRTMPLIERKKLLKSAIHGSDLIRYSDHVEDKGLALFKKMQEQGLEGVVAKKADSEYRENNRGDNWLKAKTHLRQEVVIGGFTEPRGTRQFLGSLIVGVYDKGEFKYVGHSGGGIPDKLRRDLRERLLRLERKTSPFITEPKPNAPVHWVRPELVCEMSFAEWTSEGYMRQPQFEGLRSDKKPVNVRRETAKSSSKPRGARTKKGTETTRNKEEKMATNKDDELTLTHLDKVFFPDHGYTKGDLIEYYKSVADYILPYLKDRAHSMLRQPDGIKGFKFFQKNNEHLPEWVPSADIYSDSNEGNLHWIVGGQLDTLLYMVQLGTIEMNPWNSRIQKLDYPDWAIIDLDPEGIGFEEVITIAREVKKLCDEWDIPCYPKTSGKTGIHIFIPLGAKYTHEQAKNFAHLIVLEINKRQPKITSVERLPEKRKHKIYLDFLQNREGQTLAAPYSVRPTKDASVSMPLHWDEVKSGLKPSDFTIKNALKRLERTGDLWKPVLGKGIDLPKVLKTIERKAAENPDPQTNPQK
ncbi:MAG TPA: DNA ligase D [Candidatus Saccharimonadales bacterium]